MATWMQTQTATTTDRQYSLFFSAILGEASESEIEERYVSLARAILTVEPADTHRA